MTQASNRSLLIVGAGPGIGMATAARFGAEGWSIIAAGRDAAALEARVAALRARGIEARALAFDAADPAAMAEAMAQADRLVGGLTAVLYNAAAVRRQDLFSMTDAEILEDL